MSESEAQNQKSGTNVLPNIVGSISWLVVWGAILFAFRWWTNNAHNNYVPAAGWVTRTNLLQCGQTGTLLEYRVVNTSTFPLEDRCSLKIFLDEEYDEKNSSITELIYEEVGPAEIQLEANNGGTKIIVTSKLGDDNITLSPGRSFGIRFIHATKKGWTPRAAMQVCNHGYTGNITSVQLDEEIRGPLASTYLIIGAMIGIGLTGSLAFIAVALLKVTKPRIDSPLVACAKLVGNSIGAAIVSTIEEHRLEKTVERETEILKSNEKMPVGTPTTQPPASSITSANPRRGKTKGTR